MRLERKIICLALVFTLIAHAAFVTRNFSENLGDTQPGTCTIGDDSYDTDNGVTYKCTSTNVFTPTSFPLAYGQLWEDSAGTVITLPTANNFVKWVSSTVGVSSGLTLSAGTDNITVNTGSGGDYLVQFSASFTGTVNSTFHWAVFVDGAKQDTVSVERKIGASADIGSIAVTGIVTLTDTQVVDLRASATADTKTVTVNHVSLTISRIGI